MSQMGIFAVEDTVRRVSSRESVFARDVQEFPPTRIPLPPKTSFHYSLVSKTPPPLSLSLFLSRSRPLPSRLWLAIQILQNYWSKSFPLLLALVLVRSSCDSCESGVGDDLD